MEKNLPLVGGKSNPSEKESGRWSGRKEEVWVGGIKMIIQGVWFVFFGFSLTLRQNQVLLRQKERLLFWEFSFEKWKVLVNNIGV